MPWDSWNPIILDTNLITTVEASKHSSVEKTTSHLSLKKKRLHHYPVSLTENKDCVHNSKHCLRLSKNHSHSFLYRLIRGYHVSILELHGFSMMNTELVIDNHLASFGSTLNITWFSTLKRMMTKEEFIRNKFQQPWLWKLEQWRRENDKDEDPFWNILKLGLNREWKMGF